MSTKQNSGGASSGGGGSSSAGGGSGGGGNSGGGGSGDGTQEDRLLEPALFPLVLQLTNPEQRESALLELSKKREAFSDLAPILWHSFGTISALLQEIISIYPTLSPPNLTAHASNRVCNALALLQCVASHQETRRLFLEGTQAGRQAGRKKCPGAIH